jgi:hypothetical protein
MQLDAVTNVHERIVPGDVVPAGQCPTCGAFCQPVEALKDMRFAKVEWSPGDVLDLMPDWEEDRAAEWLSVHSGSIQEVLTERGWEALRDLLINDEYKPEGD